MMGGKSYGEILFNMAQEVYGKPTATGTGNYRFKGSKGVSVDTNAGRWFDFTEDKGGSCKDFIAEHFPSEPVADVFRRFGGSDFLNGQRVGALDK